MLGAKALPVNSSLGEGKDVVRERPPHLKSCWMGTGALLMPALAIAARLVLCPVWGAGATRGAVRVNSHSISCALPLGSPPSASHSSVFRRNFGSKGLREDFPIPNNKGVGRGVVKIVRCLCAP
jgi:hypothetical protein